MKRLLLFFSVFAICLSLSMIANNGSTHSLSDTETLDAGAVSTLQRSLDDLFRALKHDLAILQSDIRFNEEKLNENAALIQSVRKNTEELAQNLRDLRVVLLERLRTRR